MDDELSHYQDGVLCSVSPGLTVWPMGGVGDGVRWPELPSSVRWNEGKGRGRGREAEKERKGGKAREREAEIKQEAPSFSASSVSVV